MIKIVKEINDARCCDELLTKLILDERNYNNLIDENYKVVNYFENIIENENNILLAYYDDNKIVGYLFLKPISDEIFKGYLFDGLYVEKEYRNKGYAKELISFANELLEDKNISFLDVNVMYDNDAAKNLYKYFGFKELKLTMRKDINN